MLSLLESSAYSSETLIKIQNIEKLKNEVERTISFKILEDEFNKVLNIIVFKFILLMYGYLEHKNTDKEKLVEVLKKSPINFIYDFIDFYRIEYEEFFESKKELNEFYGLFSLLKKKKKTFDTDMILES